MIRTSAIILALALGGVPAEAALPEPVRAMVAAAARSGDQAKIDAVVAVAKETHPDDAAEVDAIVARIAEDREKARIAALASAGPFDNWTGRVDLGGSVQTGNADTRNLALVLQIVRDGLSWRHRAEASADIQRSDGATDQQRILAAFQSDWKLSDRLFLWGRFDFETNFDAGVRRRFIESAGIGWRALARETLTWDVEVGPAARQTRFDDGRREDSLAFRGASRFSWTFAPKTRLTNDSFLFVEAASSLNNTAAISTSLFGNLVAGLSLTYLWEEEPAPGLRSSSTITRFTVGYGF
ncbi:DUF481 domain-containing protein [Thermaurantiacus sp.]